VKPLWASLDDRQKRLLPVLMREGRQGKRIGRHHRDGHHGRMGMMQHGPGSMRQGGNQQAPAQAPKQQ
jgi:hypothetical protein